MHAEAYEWVRQHASTEPVAVLDIGGRDINGTVRSLFPNAAVYRVLDIADGPNVDIVADASVWAPDREYDVVVCCECFEHTPLWRQICGTAYRACRPGGRFVATMAGPGRPEHSAIDGGWRLHPGEHYANIHPQELLDVLTAYRFTDIEVDQQPKPADVRCVATKPRAVN